MSNSHYDVNDCKRGMGRWFNIFRSGYRPVPLLIILMIATSSIILVDQNIGKTYAQAETNFPPPIFYKLRNEPSYVIDIPFSPIRSFNLRPFADLYTYRYDSYMVQ